MATPARIDQVTDSDAQFERKVFAVVVRELGLGGLARFIRLHHSGPGDYTRDRAHWLADLTVEEIASNLKQ